MSARNPSDHLLPVASAIAAGALNLTAGAGAINGARIIAPAQSGRYLVFLLGFPVLTGVTAFSARLEGSNDGGSTWSPVKQNDGATDLAFTGASFIAGGAYANKVAMGSIDMTRGKYKDYRLGNITVTGANLLVSVIALIHDVYAEATGQADEWYSKFLPTGS